MSELFDSFSNADTLYRSFYLSRKDSQWKGSVQWFERYLFLNIHALQKELREGTYKQQPCVTFKIMERGKPRLIKAHHIRDRVVQRALCDEVLNPILERSLIYDNGASIAGKGITFTRDRLQAHLEKFYRKHGANGYILKIDFSKFFDNIDHEIAIKAMAKKIDDPRIMGLIESMIDDFKIDISNLTEEQAEALETTPFDSLTYRSCADGMRYLRRSLGIGAQISQTIGIFYPTPIDFYCKVKRQCKFYGRYMDDIYIIHESKEFLEDVLKGVLETAKELKLFVNPRKTTIAPLHCGFTFMKVRYSYTESGHIVKRLTPEAFTRERRRLKSYRRLLDAGRITRQDARNFYQSFRGAAKRFDNYRSLRNLDKLYDELFVQY